MAGPPLRSVPETRYPLDLPILNHRDEIVAAIREHPVVIVAGETGSGKSTQLPKLCMDAGRGAAAMIGHTQPRRIAARTIAERVAEELDVEIGGAVGYAMRFTDRVSASTVLKVMTDGILLAELPHDRALNRYDTLIVDEAHERSLNIDFILGYLKQLLPRRPDLRIIVTSATIDTATFSRHFDDAPIIEVSGRTYPVEVRYSPVGVAEGDDRDQVQAICDAVQGLQRGGSGDVLVFLSGEREIHDTADALRRLDLRDTEILPLYARLSSAEQHRVFQSHRGRRVVLATNVAETSLTVPGVRYVIDPGTARISRYNRRTKVQRLPIEDISCASANQRAGRCGRVAPGICIRLYGEDDFERRPEFTEPEILRTNLASVILQMASIGLGDIAAFPFVEAPDARNVNDGIALLDELGALLPVTAQPTGPRRLTPIGRRLARLPIDPRLGRMVLEAERYGCVREVMIIAAALSIQDPRERPADHREQAEEHHNRFLDKDSDFVAYLNLWQHLRDRQRELSGNQFRKLCRAEYLNYVRVREWQDIFSQLREVAHGLGIRLNSDPGPREGIHMALLAGLLSQVGARDDARQDYRSARGGRFSIAGGSVLAKRPPKWVMAAEIVETNRPWARTAARVSPESIERLGAHLLRRSHGEAYWDADRGTAMTSESVTLYGLTLVAARPIPLSRIDRDGARELFIRHALVEGDWRPAPTGTDGEDFVVRNQRRIEQVEALESRVRRRNLLVSDEVLHRVFASRVPDDIVSTRHFDRWWKSVRHAQPDLLDLAIDDLVDPSVPLVDLAGYPDTWEHNGLALRLTYVFAPGDPADGLTVHIPVAVLNQVDAADFGWHIPARREELVTALIRALPKQMRRHLVPVPDYVRGFLQAAGPGDGPIRERLSVELGRLTGERIPPGAWNLDALSEDLRVRFRVMDDERRTLAAGRDLTALKAEVADRMLEALADAAPGIERADLRDWTIGTLPRFVEQPWRGTVVRGYPALVDEGASGVSVRLLATEVAQIRAMVPGTRRLLRLTVPPPGRALQRHLDTAQRLALADHPYASVAALFDDCIDAAVDTLAADAGGPAWDEASFRSLQVAVRRGLEQTAVDAVRAVAEILHARTAAQTRLDALTAAALEPTVADAQAHLNRLVRDGFVTSAGVRRLPDVLRYLRAVERRLDRVGADAGRDRVRIRRVQLVEREYEDLLAAFADEAPHPDVERIRWLIEELRVASFAQAVGTAEPVSETRILKEMDRLAPRV